MFWRFGGPYCCHLQGEWNYLSEFWNSMEEGTVWGYSANHSYKRWKEGIGLSRPNKTVYNGNINHLVHLRNAYSFHGTVTEIDRHNLICFHCLDVSFQANNISDFWFVFISQSFGNITSNYVILFMTIWRNFALWTLPTKVTVCTSGNFWSLFPCKQTLHRRNVFPSSFFFVLS